MSSNAQKAEALIAEAHKKTHPSGFLGMLSGPRWDEGAELYSKAANMYKIAKQWDQAGDTYVQAAECHKRDKFSHDAATCYINAAGCYKKSNPPKAKECMEKAINYYTEEGRFAIAAKYQKELAEMCEAEEDIEGAMSAYEVAAEYYEGEGSVASASQCLLKVAHYAALKNDYKKAIDIYERTAETSLDNKLLKYGVKDHFLKAAICFMASGDAVAARRALEKYQEQDYTFKSTRECTFISACIEAMESYDVEGFTNAVVEFDSIQPLDNWKTTLLLRIKNSIKDEDPSLV